MNLVNLTGLPAAWTMGFDPDGRELLVVVVKATYALPAQGGEALQAAEQMPLVEADRFSGDPATSAPLFETDFAHRKPACDVLLVGSAHAPSGRPVRRLEVALSFGGMSKALAVLGPRTWQRNLLGVCPGEPKPFERLPLTYDCAFGGTDRCDEADGKTHTFLANPVGKGYSRHAEAVHGEAMPNTEELGRAVESPRGSYRPMAFSPIGRHWTPRSGYAGTYDQRWKESTAPMWPDDFNPRYFQAAPPDQIVPFPKGGEEMILRNLTPDGRRAFRLPSRAMPVMVVRHGASDVTLEPNIDTVVLEPDEERFTLTWRACLPMARSLFDVREVIVGEPTAAWRRARRFPGKDYYANLGELVRARRGRRRA